MEIKSGQPNTTVGDAETTTEKQERHENGQINENTLISSGMYKDIDHGYRSIEEMSQDFEIRRLVNCQARFMRGDYSVNGRIERYLRPPWKHPNPVPDETSKNFPDTVNIEDQHLIRPFSHDERKRK